MKKKSYYALDIAKFISAFLVICIHTAPLIDISETANFILVQIIARVAVPFFFITSGYLFFRKINIKKGFRDEENLKALQHYLLRLVKIYLIWTVLYLPFSYLLRRGENGITFAVIALYLRDFLFAGSYYHLWFLPALMCAVCIVYFLLCRYGMKKTLITTGALYFAGMLVNVYADLLTMPVIKSLIDIYNTAFVTTRNGLFFGCIFIALGAFLAKTKIHIRLQQKLIGFVLSFTLLCVECTALRFFDLMHDLTSMYLFVVPTVVFLLMVLLDLTLKPRKCYLMMRVCSLLIYVSHIMFVVVLFTLLPEGHHLLCYVLASLISLIFAGAIYLLAQKFPILKHLYG